jgi:hypothetical protein
MTLKSNPLQTVLTITVGFVVLFVLFDWQWALSLAVVIGVSGLISNYLARKIEWVWHKLTYILSLIVPNILLSLIFFLVLFPIALLNRLVKKSDLLHLKPQAGSNWVEVHKKFNAKTIQNPW